MAYRYRRRHSLAGLIFTLLIALLTYGSQQGWFNGAQQMAARDQPGLYHVTRFVDGDTVAINMNGHEEKVRLIGVDTPETHKPNTPVQCYGLAAAAFTKNTLGGQPIRLVSDSLSTDRDRYNRLLRYIYLTDGSNFNEKLIQGGYAFYYPYFPFSKSEQFAADQAAAKAANKGLWGNCSPTPTDGGGYVSNNAG